MMTSAVRIDLIGAGFIGRPHALTIHAVNRVSPACPLHAQAHMVAETDVGCVGAACNLGFESSTNRWDAVDRSDAVIIAVPSVLHLPTASGAIVKRGRTLRPSLGIVRATGGSLRESGRGRL